MLDALCLRFYVKVSVYSMLTIGTVSINEIYFCNFFVIFSLIFIFSKEKHQFFLSLVCCRVLTYNIFHLYVWNSIFIEWFRGLNES